MGVEKMESVLPALGLGDISPFLNKLGDFKLGSSSTRIFRFGYMMWRMGHARGIGQMGKKVWDKEYDEGCLIVRGRQAAKLWRARSWLYPRRCLQVNIRLN